MPKFLIFHPADERCNHECRVDIPFQCIGEIEAESLMAVFGRAQNDFSMAYRKLKKRSTCVGDVVVDDKGNAFMIMDTGFKSLTMRSAIVVNVSIEEKPVFNRS